MSRKKKIITIFVALIIFLLIAGGIGYYLNQNNQLPIIGNSNIESQDEVEELVIKVGKLIKLPNETPEIATVSDISQLEGQSIFKNAENGDKVLIFGDSRRAIVYRPSENIIIEVGNLVVSPEGTPSAAADLVEVVESKSVIVLNGTSTAGLASSVGNDLTSSFSNIEITDTGNAVEDYGETIVIDVSGDNSDLVERIADELGASVDDLPSGEDEPNVDILIILGQ